MFNGDFSTYNVPRPGRPKKVTTPEIIDQIHELILEDRRISAKSIAEKLGFSRERVGSIIHEGLDMRTKDLSAPPHINLKTGIETRTFWTRSSFLSFFFVCLTYFYLHSVGVEFNVAYYHTQWHIHTYTHTHTNTHTIDKTPLEEWSARQRTLTTHNTHMRQTSMPPAGFEPAVPASERPLTHALDRTATGIGGHNCNLLNSTISLPSWRNWLFGPWE